MADPKVAAYSGAYPIAPIRSYWEDLRESCKKDERETEEMYEIRMGMERKIVSMLTDGNH